MSTRRDGRLHIACRFIPHDQWITTHIEPSWTIHVVKQCILSKCTGEPYNAPPSLRQVRRRAHVSKKPPSKTEDSSRVGERPVSPLTFAPDPRQRPVSPILFAKARTVGKERRRPKDAVADDAGLTGTGAASPVMVGEAGGVDELDDVSEENEDDKEGYEEDDEWDTAEEFDEDDEDDDLDLSLPPASLSPLPMGGAVLPDSRKLISAPHSPHNGKAGLTPAGAYTLVRFSTGQILEDEQTVSRYNFAPHELLELHSHVIQPPEHPPQVSGHKHTRNASIFSITTSGEAESSHTPEKRYLPRLNRTSLTTYVLPYFEGWVLALRVVWREDPLLASSFYGSGGGYAGAGFGSSFGHAIESAYGLSSDWSRGRRRGRRGGGADKAGEGKELGGGKGEQGRAERTTSLQWRARWLVVKEGWVRLYRTRDDTTPTHELPLSALMTLRGQEHLEQGAHLVPKKATRNGRDKPYREHGAGSVHENDAQSTHTAGIQGTISPRNRRSLSPSRLQSRSRSRAGHHADHHSDSYSDGHTPGSAATVGREKFEDCGSDGVHGLESTGGAGPAHADGEERRVVCMKFRSQSAWAVPPPSPPVPGGDGKGKGRGNEKGEKGEKEEKIRKGRKKGRLDKRSLERALVGAKIDFNEDDARGSAVGAALHNSSHPQMDLGGSTAAASSFRARPEFALSGDGEQMAELNEEGMHKEGEGDEDAISGCRAVVENNEDSSRGGEVRFAPLSSGAKIVSDDEDAKKTRRQEREQKEKEKGEWVILDMGADLAYSSFLRILHRHFPAPISSSFISGFPTFSTPTPLSTPTPTPTPTPFPSPTSPHPPVSAAPFPWSSSPGTLSGKADDIKMGIHDPELPSPLSTSSRSSHFHSDPPQHPPALAAPTVHTPLPVPQTFGALPYPEWRMEVVERAQKAGMGNIGRAMQWVLWGCADQLADDLVEMHPRKDEGDEADDEPPKPKETIRSFTLKNRRQSTTSTVEITPGSIYDSDVSEDMGKILMNMSDSEGESSEVEWHGWMADLHRQHRVQAQKEREVADAALH